MRWLAQLFMLLYGLAACNQQSNSPQQPQALHFDHTIFLNDQAFKVALLATSAEREQGLMWLKELPKDSGALFVFEQESKAGFWMKNTLIPLDILFFNAQGKLIKNIQAAQPCSESDCPIFTVEQVKFVLELGVSPMMKQILKAQPTLFLKI